MRETVQTHIHTHTARCSRIRYEIMLFIQTVTKKPIAKCQRNRKHKTKKRRKTETKNEVIKYTDVTKHLGYPTILFTRMQFDFDYFIMFLLFLILFLFVFKMKMFIIILSVANSI